MSGEPELLLYRTFYYKQDGTTGVIRIKCPDVECSYFVYWPLPSRETLNETAKFAIYDFLLVRLYKDHPHHYCTRCKRTHVEGQSCDGRT